MKLLKTLLRMRHYRQVTAYLLACLMLFNIILPVARAGPEGAQVVNGQVSIQQNGNNTAITASDKAIVNYSSFDIARPETVQFIQPSSSASVLNRILSANPTNINGTLLANGRVFFVNPAGVYIGSGARINVNQLVASALNISDADFINGRYNFVGGNGAVINSGDISAEKVYLIGKQVVNSGNISCPAGYVVMAAGDRVFIGEPGSDIVLEIDASSLSESAGTASSGVGVLNEGTVEAAGGIIALAAAGDIYSQAISNVGSLSTSVEAGNAGQIKLTAAGGTVTNTGTIEATSTSGTGGTVQMLGDKVGLLDAAEIDVSGSDGGGTVLVGGDYQGKGDIPTASRTYVSPDSSIKADATENGDGGRVIVWADEVTGFYGNISARGGAEGGDGGFVEVSGKGNLDFYGYVDTLAPQGNIGTLLLDPLDIEVVTGGLLDLTDVDAFADDGSDPDVSKIDPATINGAGTNVDLQAQNTITVTDSISMSNDGVGITARAGDYIKVDAPITTRSGTLDFTANDSGGMQSDSGYIDLNAALDTTGGGLTGGGVILTVDGGTGDIQLGNNITTNTANITFEGPVTLTADSALSTTDGVDGDISFDSNVKGDYLLTLTAGTGNIDFLSTIGDTMPLSGLLVNSAATLDLDNTVALDDQGLDITAGTVGIDNTITTTTGGAVNIANSEELTIASGANMNLDGAFDQDGAGAVSTAGDIITTDDDIKFDAEVTLTGDVTLNTGSGIGDIEFASNVKGDYLLSLTAGTGNVDFLSTIGDTDPLSGLLVNSAATLDLDDTVALDDQGLDITAGTIIIDNTVSITNGGSFASSGTTFNNAGAITTNGGNVTLTHTGAVTVGADIVAGSGDISVTGPSSVQIDAAASGITCDNFTITTSGTFNASSGSVITASSGTGGDITINAAGVTLEGTTGGQLINTGSNNIFISDSADTLLGNDSINIEDGTLTINSNSINALAGPSGDEIYADGDLSLTAATEIGGTRTVDITGAVDHAGTLTVNSNGDGNVDIGIDNDQFDAVNITITGVTDDTFEIIWGTGPDEIDLETDSILGVLTVTEVDTSNFDTDVVITQNVGNVLVKSVDTDDGDFTLTATTGAITDDTSPEAANITASNAFLTASTGIGGSGDADIDTAVDALTAHVTSIGDIYIEESDGTELTDVDTLSGSTDIISNTGDLTIGDIDATGTVTLEATSGSINDAADDTAEDISATTITMTAADEIGGDAALEVASSALDVSVTNEGDIVLTESDGTELTDVDTLSGSIDIVSTTGDLTIGDIEATGTITLEATSGSINDAGDDMDVDIEGTTVTLMAHDEIGGGIATKILDTRGALEVASSALDVSVTNAGDIVLTESDGTELTDVDTLSGSIDIISNTGDLTIGDIDATGTVTLAATAGSINDAAGDTVEDISADTIIMTAADEIGGTGTLETTVANLEAHSTTAGDIVITESDGITLTDVDTVAGNIMITAGGSINGVSVIATDGSVDLSAGGLLTATDVQANESAVVGDYDVTLATSADNIEVGSLTADNAISLEATNGAITQGAGIITANGGSLTMMSDADLNMINYNVANPGGTNLTLDSTGGSAIVTSSAADDWNLITAAAQHDLVLSGDGDITTGNLESRDTSGLYGIQISTDTGSGGSLDALGSVTSGGFLTVDVDGQASFAQPVSAGGKIELEAGSNITTNTLTSTNGNIVVESTGGNLEINGGLTANDGGVSLIAKSGSIYTPGSKVEIRPGVLIDALNVPITGSSDYSLDTGVELPYGPSKAAIVILSEDDLGLGTDATLTAGGTYSSAVDDRDSVNFASSGLGSGDAIDVAIYLGSYRPGPGGNVAVESTVSVEKDSTMVIDAGDTVTFGAKFYESVFNQTNRLEVVSRRSTTLNGVIAYNRLPHADDPEAIRSYFTLPGSFTGAYVLRGVKTLLAEVLALANPVPLVPPRPLEPEISGEVEGPDTEALVRLLNELGIGIQPYVTEAYADSLSTDLRLYKAAERLQELIPVLEDADGTRIAGLRAAVAQYFPTLDVISEEQLDSFAQELARHRGDGTDYDLARECIFALTEYVNILGTEIGWPVEKSVEFVMGRYVPRLTEGDEIRIAVIQMHLQKELGV